MVSGYFHEIFFCTRYLLRLKEKIYPRYFTKRSLLMIFIRLFKILRHSNTCRKRSVTCIYYVERNGDFAKRERMFRDRSDLLSYMKRHEQD